MSCEKMKIAFITRSVGGGGAERVVSVLANEFSRRVEIDEVSVIAIIEDYVTYPINSDVIYRANTDKTVAKVKRVYKRYSFLKKCIKELAPDVVISFCTQINIYSIFAMRGDRAKLIISERNDPNNDPIQKWVRKFRNIVYPLADGIVLQTPDAAEYFKNFLKKPSHVIANPIKENLPNPYNGIREKRIVTVARLSPAKNLPMLIRAFQAFGIKHLDYKLEIYGEGPLREVLEELIKELDLESKVYLMGYTEDLHMKILSATCFVLASDYEGISNAMLEALALGVPTICTDCPIGGSRMFINNMNNGILVPVGDQLALEKALHELVESSSLQKHLSKEAVKIRQELTPEKIAKQWMDFIGSIV